jgi:hypothetical protein
MLMSVLMNNKGGFIMYDDWIHWDDYDKEVTALEDQIADLKEEIEARANNEVFTLAEIILIRDGLLHGLGTYDAINNLNKLIASHNASIRVAAMSKINNLEAA